MRVRWLKTFWTNRHGGTVIEYAMIAALITLGLIVAITSIGNSTKAMYENLDSHWDDAAGGGGGGG